MNNNEKFSWPVFLGNHSDFITVSILLMCFVIALIVIINGYTPIGLIILASAVIIKIFLDMALDPYYSIGYGIFNTKDWIEEEKIKVIKFPISYHESKYIDIEPLKKENPEVYKDICEKIIPELKTLYLIADYNNTTRDLFYEIDEEINNLYKILNKSITNIIEERNEDVLEYDIKNFQENIDEIILYIKNISKDIEKIYDEAQERKMEIDNFKMIKKFNQEQNRNF